MEDLETTVERLAADLYGAYWKEILPDAASDDWHLVTHESTRRGWLAVARRVAALGRDALIIEAMREMCRVGR